MNQLIRRQLRHYGLRATATVISRTHRARWPTADLRDYDYILAVRPPGEPAFQAKVREKFAIVALKPEEGDVDVPVRFDPKTHEVAFDLIGDPRYDAEAAQIRHEARFADVRALKAGSRR
jgi:hypothetical protein